VRKSRSLTWWSTCSSSQSALCSPYCACNPRRFCEWHLEHVSEQIEVGSSHRQTGVTGQRQARTRTIMPCCCAAASAIDRTVTGWGSRGGGRTQGSRSGWPELVGPAVGLRKLLFGVQRPTVQCERLLACQYHWLSACPTSSCTNPRIVLLQHTTPWFVISDAPCCTRHNSISVI